MALIVTNSRGIAYAVQGTKADAEAAMKAGYIWITPSMIVSTAGVQIDILPEMVKP